jgi:hypothetical protein
MIFSNWPMVFYCPRCHGRSNFLLCPTRSCRDALLRGDAAVRPKSRADGKTRRQRNPKA